MLETGSKTVQLDKSNGSKKGCSC